jgi:hypothetical protein
MTWFSKLKWVLAILLVFFLILMTNLIDRDNFRIINETVTAMYEDRIVANDLIFELTLLIHQKELAVAKSDTSFFNNDNKEVNYKIEELLNEYENTQLTPQEAKIFRRLKEDLDKKNSIDNIIDNNTDAYIRQLGRVKKNLQKLAKIQLSEGRNKMLVSQKVFKGVELFTRIEIYLLVFIAIVLQVIIFYNPKKK